MIIEEQQKKTMERVITKSQNYLFSNTEFNITSKHFYTGCKMITTVSIKDQVWLNVVLKCCEARSVKPLEVPVIQWVAEKNIRFNLQVDL